MADERYQWLDQEAAERLLRGEPVEAVDDRARAEAARLAEALGTARVQAVPPAARTELPGEAAALAAFRKATAERAAATAAAGASVPADRTTAAELGRIRLAPVTAPARRWGRSVRYGLAAAVAAVTVGGVAVAAGTGVLPLIGPAPASSVSAGETTDPLVSEEPGIRQDPETPPTGSGDSGGPTPGSSPSADSGSTAPTPRVPDGHGTVSRPPGTPTPGRTPGGGDAAGTGSADARERALKACREYRTGKLDAADRQRLLNTLRNGDTLRVYCDRILSGDTGSSEGAGQDSAGGGSKGGKGDGKDDSDDDSDRKDGSKVGSKGGSKGGSGSGSASAGGSGDQRGGTGNQNGGVRLDTAVTAALPAGITAGTRLPLGV
ncbi:hypothetical protein [Streptomyces globisporus]|uniref:hypothetical protein n=1 Tax=Streptomyces globisporus TaxID=1908 RepID=UPI00069223EF|nr:hypothetical protein [Streptomyces globisporus]